MDRDVDVEGDIPIDVDGVGEDILMDVDGVGEEIPMDVDGVGEEIPFFRQLIGRDTRVVEYGGMLLSHVNALRQYAHGRSKMPLPGARIS